jgi:hypothetical protein
MRDDPFIEFRTSQKSFDAVTGTDGRSLTLVATDVAHFHSAAHQVIALANKYGWRVTEIRHQLPGANVASITVTPAR